DGNIISYDASGNPVAIATGNDGQILTSAGAGAPPAFEDAAGGSSRYFWAHHNDTGASQVLSTGVHTKVTLSTNIQSHSAFSDANDKWTATADDAGDWMFFGQVSFYSTGNNMDNPIANIAKNGTRSAGGYDWVWQSTDSVRHFTARCQAVLTIAENDYIELYGMASSGGTLYVFGGDSSGYKQTQIMGFKL
ncbi:MAG: hypothetical protein QF535_02500, partial [Anaerolineales bacterium]|nr:hypothetical protein [Anaerolineales bacterium]